MSWDHQSLFAKAKLYVERALSQDREDPEFGLWCSLGLELLARAALAFVSPTLLAEPDRDHKHLLHALNRGDSRVQKKSLGIFQVLDLCTKLVPNFSKDNLQSCLALINRRNDELHSGIAAFEEYPSKEWLSNFYRSCQTLTQSMGESLESLLGKSEAVAAAKMLDESDSQARSRVERAIATARTAFETLPEAERAERTRLAKLEGEKLSHLRHHRVSCPACSSVGLVHGELFGQPTIRQADSEIITSQPVMPNEFRCPACGLEFHGSQELELAKVGGQYSRTTSYSPEEYYGLVDIDSIDIDKLISERLAEMEYDND